MRFSIISVLLIVTNVGMQAEAQDSPTHACNNAAELYSNDDLTGALEEAKWCVTLLEQEQQERTIGIFPDTLQGFEGDEVEHQSALGFSSTVREYKKQQQRITVTLSSNNGMGAALAALSQFGGRSTKTRIQKRSANIIIDGDRSQVLITLKKGGLLMFAAANVDRDSLVEFAKAFPVATLDESR